MEDTEWIIVVARGNTCCSLYKRVLQGSKTGGVVTYGGSTKRVWCQCIGHRKVDVSDKNETLQGDFSGGDIYEGKRANVVEDESSSPKSQVHSLVNY